MKNRNTSIPTATLLLLLTTWCATSALGGISVTSIPLYGTDTSNEGRAITYDGRYVVGLSGTGLGFFYDVGGNAVYNPIGGGAQATIVTGVGYRTNLSSQLEVVLSGLTSSGYGNWMTTDSGVTWGAKRRDTNMGTYPWKVPSANGLAGTSSDVFYSAFFDSAASSTIHWYVGQFSGAWPMTPVWSPKDIPSENDPQVWGISSSGRSVGTRKDVANGFNYLRNFYYNWAGTAAPVGAAFRGLDGTTKGIAFSVSADGNTIFGHSPTVSDQVNNYGYKVTFSSNPLTNNATTQASTNALPEFADTMGSASREIPYGCTVDGQYAAGMNYRGMEKAVIWDTSNADPNNWTVVDLTDLASANGGLDIFGGNLRRAFSIGTNAAGDLAITGRGYSPSDANYRAFLMTVPKWVAAIQFPINQTVNYGSNVTFTVRTNGTDPLSFQWYKNGEALASATSTSISYASVSCLGGEAGNYYVVVSNASVSGVVTGAVTLTVNDPFILTQPSPTSRTNIEGTTVTYTVSAGGAPTLSYRWQRNGSDLTDGDTGWGSTISGSSTPTLTISNVKAADGTNTPGSGIYRAVVKTSAGDCETPSRAATLMVVERPVLSSIAAAGTDYRLDISGPSGQTYTLLYSTNIALPLSSWTPLTTSTFLGGPESYWDIGPTDPQRFYILTTPAVITSP